MPSYKENQPRRTISERILAPIRTRLRKFTSSANSPDSYSLQGSKPENIEDQRWQILETILVKSVEEYNVEIEDPERIITIKTLDFAKYTKVKTDEDGRIFFMPTDNSLDEQMTGFTMNLQQEPNNFGSWYGLGQAYFQKNEADKSIRCLKRATEINPKDSAAWHNLGEVYFNLKKDFKNAKDCWSKALEINPEDFEDLHNLGVAYDSEGEEDVAISYYKKAAEANPSYIPSLWNLSLLLFNKGLTTDARNFMLKAIELDPSLIERLKQANLMRLLDGR